MSLSPLGGAADLHFSDHPHPTAPRMDLTSCIIAHLAPLLRQDSDRTRNPRRHSLTWRSVVCGAFTNHSSGVTSLSSRSLRVHAGGRPPRPLLPRPALICTFAPPFPSSPKFSTLSHLPFASGKTTARSSVCTDCARRAKLGTTLHRHPVHASVDGTESLRPGRRGPDHTVYKQRIFPLRFLHHSPFQLLTYTTPTTLRLRATSTSSSNSQPALPLPLDGGGGNDRHSDFPAVARADIVASDSRSRRHSVSRWHSRRHNGFRQSFAPTSWLATVMRPTINSTPKAVSGD